MPPLGKENFAALFEETIKGSSRYIKFVQGPESYFYGGGDHKAIAEEAGFVNPTFGGTLVARVSRATEQNIFDVVPIAGTLGLGPWSSGRERAKEDLNDFAEGTGIHLNWLD